MKYEWSKMTSRERDALVAENVMGWARCSEFAGDWHGQPPMVRGTVTIPQYTTDIAATWEVVEKVHEKGLSIVVQRWAYADAKWIADVGGYIREESDSAPEAICMATLRAMGVDVG